MVDIDSQLKLLLASIDYVDFLEKLGKITLEAETSFASSGDMSWESSLITMTTILQAVVISDHWYLSQCQCYPYRGIGQQQRSVLENN